MNVFSSDSNKGPNESTECDDSSVNTLYETVDLSEVCYLCVHYSDGKCGSTLYHSSSHSIQLVNEFEDNDFESLEELLMQTEPNHLIISSKSDPKLIEILQMCAKERTRQTNHSTTSDSRQESAQTSEKSTNSSASDLMWKMEFHFDLHMVSHTLFGFQNAKNRILSLNIENDLCFRDENQKILYFSSIIDFSNNNTFKSFGALLRFLDSNGVDIQMQTNRSTVEISNISRLYLQKLVTIERTTYESLQIFQQEWHPSAVKQGFNQKEGLSLYGLFNCCVSKIGSNYLRKMFLLPTQETDIIMDRLQAIQFFIEPQNCVLRDNLNQHLKHIKTVTALFNRLTNTGALTIPDLQLLNNNLLNALRIRDLIVRQMSALQIFQQIVKHFTEEMDRLTATFHSLIDFEKSISSQSFEINYGIDAELDQTKYHFIHLPQYLEEMAQKEIEIYGNILSDCNSVYIPQIGFLTSVRVEDGVTPPHEINEELKFLVKVGNRYYYRTQLTVHFDQQFGDIQSEIIDRQIQIINQFQELIVNKKYLFVSIVKCCAKLDALIAMSQTAVTYHYTKPNICTDGRIEIIEGRHPLIELTSNGFIPNDYLSGDRYKKAKLISGPNACGKSVYLKQICLIVYLAHIGSFVPALRANISIVDRIFSRIHNLESISLRLSTFLLDLKQISNAVKNATKRSLVVIDEFGKGTQPVDGIALMVASIGHWLIGNAPHLIVSSHFRCLPAIINRDDLIECQTFEFRQNVNGLQYLFKLTDGHFKDSIASQIAYMADIPIDFIKRGLKLCELMSNNKAIDFTETEELKHKYKTYEEVAQNFLALNTTEEQIKEFFDLHFCQSSASEE